MLVSEEERFSPSSALPRNRWTSLAPCWEDPGGSFPSASLLLMQVSLEQGDRN